MEKMTVEHLYEAIVGAFLSRNKRFVCPQYVIRNGEKSEWRCADFVVLDLEEKRVIIAEVTTAADLGTFAAKAIELHEQGREKVRRQLVAGFKAYPNIAEW